MAKVSHLIRYASSGHLIFFRFTDPWRSCIVAWRQRVFSGIFLIAASSLDSSTLSRISEPEEDHSAWRRIWDEMRCCSHQKTVSPEDQNYLINLFIWLYLDDWQHSKICSQDILREISDGFLLKKTKQNKTNKQTNKKKKKKHNIFGE